MASVDGRDIHLNDYSPGKEVFRTEVLNGLQKPQKELPCKYFYDKRGSVLYERICSLDEYYIPDTEVSIMETYIREIVPVLGAGILLVEYGSGSSFKTRILLDNLQEVVAYVPIDISREQLLRVSEQINNDYPGLEVLPVNADYTSDFRLPLSGQPDNRVVVYYPGSTIGNFEPDSARLFLEHIGEVCGPGGGLLIGVDLKKDQDVLHRAYNDSQGVTAAFNLNLLERINRELGADFRTDRFEHHAFYNPDEGRVEMHLVSLEDQTVNIDGTAIQFAEGESIWTENSYKYNLDEFERLAVTAGFRIERIWTDSKQWFSIQYLTYTGRA